MLQFVFSILFLIVASSQASNDQMSSDGVRIEPPLTRPTLGLKLARVSFPVSGLNPQAQSFFDQGIAALHGFWIFEAERNFREVILLSDRENPIPYFFAAYAQTVFSSGDMERGLDYLKKGEEKKRKAKVAYTLAESLWMDAIAALYDSRIVDANSRQETHIARLRDALRECWPGGQKLETQAFLALALWDFNVKKMDLKDGVELRQEIDALVDEVLRVIPNHPVHHYKIHLWNDGTNEILARDSAKRCGLANASCAHLWHMPSHIYSTLKEYRNAAYNFEAAHRVDNEYLNRLNLPGSIIHNYAHNINYLLDVLSANGGVERAVEISKNALSGPRFFDTTGTYIDPVDWTASAFIRLLEDHELWEDALQLYRSGYFAGLFTRKADQAERGKLLRFLALVGVEKQDRTMTERFGGELQELRHAVSKTEKPSKENLETLTNLEKDLRLWVTIREADLSHSILNDTYQLLINLNITPKQRIALLAADNGNLDLALEQARQGVERNASGARSRAILTYVLLQRGDKQGALSNWEQTKQLIHIPRNAQEKNNAIYVGNAFPFLARLKKAFIENLEMTQSEVEELFTIPLVSRQNSQQTWENQNGKLEKLGPITLPRPKAAVAGKHWQVWEKTKKTPTPITENLLKNGIQGDRTLLIAFRQGSQCQACDVEESKLLREWSEKLAEEKVEILLVRPDASTSPSSPKFSVAIDPTHQTYKMFGAFDEFDNIPAHGIFWIGKNGEILWHRRGLHAFSDWAGLLEEIKRQKNFRP